MRANTSLGPRTLSQHIGVLALLGALALLTACAPSRRAYFASCGDSSECETSLCSQGICTHPCTTTSQCGSGYCDGKVCKPDYRCPSDAQNGDSADADTVEAPCHLIPPQCGCPMGQGCYIPQGTPICLPAGTGIDGSYCAQDNDCHAGAACITGLPTGQQCQTLCDPAAPQTCPSGICSPSDVPGLGACMVPCDLAAQTGCGARHCYAIGAASGGYVSTCGQLAGTGVDGVACKGMLNCAPGWQCANGSCRRTCHLSSTNECATGTCKSATPAFVVGKTTYGVCLP